MKSTRAEYLEFFANWLAKEFPRNSNILRNTLIFREVQKIVCNNDEAAYWGDRSCWQMYDLASDLIKERAIVEISA